MCEGCDKLEEKKRHVVAEVEKTTPACLVCESPNATGIGTWIAGKEHQLAVGDKDGIVSVFGFWLCDEHMPVTAANEKLITQFITQEVRHGNPKQV